jgi:hypothetical protein
MAKKFPRTEERDEPWTPLSYGAGMFISYVLRLRPDRMDDDQFTAEMEAVATGQRSVVHSMDEAFDFVLSTVAKELAASRRARHLGEET